MKILLGVFCAKVDRKEENIKILAKKSSGYYRIEAA
jgi:hypothetical protein